MPQPTQQGRRQRDARAQEGTIPPLYTSDCPSKPGRSSPVPSAEILRAPQAQVTPALPTPFSAARGPSGGCSLTRPGEGPLCAHWPALVAKSPMENAV